MKEFYIAPSILSADFGKLNKEIEEVADEIKYLHIDVMDGHFVPNISIGVPVIKSIREKFKNLIFDVHLMISNPEKYIDVFANAGSDIITFHREVNINPTLVINQIRKKGKKAGISINPDTDIKFLEPVLDRIDLILIMSVFPGFGGQEFISSSLDKIKYLASKKKENGYTYLIEIDGGINTETARIAVESGAEILVAGNSVFGQPGRLKALKDIIQGCKKVIKAF